MEKNELTGIERQLVLQYLIDGNVPVTVTEVQDEKVQTNICHQEKIIKSATTGIFPIALQASFLTVLEQGIILLNNPPESVKLFDGKNVKVQFYFNKLGLFFITKMKKTSSGLLALVIPSVIYKIQERESKKSTDFSAVLYLKTQVAEKNTNINCRFFEDFQLFTTPKWADVEEEYQVTAKNYLELFIRQWKSGGTSSKIFGNGLYLMPICRFLASDKTSVESVESKNNQPFIIYVDESKIVFAVDNKNSIFTESSEFAILFSFPLKLGPIKERTIFCNLIVENVFESDDKNKSCVVCSFDQIKEEDARYLEDKKISY